MEILLGVTSKLLSEEIGNKYYWCVYKNTKVNEGDYLFLYKSKTGINQIYRITSNPIAKLEFECNYRNMLTIRTELVQNIESPITYKMMKENEILKDSGPVKRKFQAVLFSFSNEESEELIKLIKRENNNIEIPE